MKALEELYEKLCKELDTIAAKGELSASMLDTVDKLTRTLKNIEKLMASYEDEYSMDYRGGNSYARRGRSYARRRDSRGRYSRNMGGYSRHDGKEYMVEELHEMMKEASSETERQAIQRCIDQIESI